MDSSVLQLSHLDFHFAETKVLEDVSFNINKNDFIGLVGSNGAGKSTLLRLILGEINPLQGDILLFGQNIRHFHDWQKIGYIAQKNADLNADFPATVLEVITANLYRTVGWGRPIRASHKQRAMDALRLTSVEHLANRRIGELSGGQQQRVFLSRALVNNPEFLILDEATTGIDERSEGIFYDLLNNLRNQMGLTILMVSHDLAAVTAHANRMFCLGSEGFFEHEPLKPMDNEFFRKLYGYQVNLHIHEHNCAHHHGLAELSACESKAEE